MRGIQLSNDVQRLRARTAWVLTLGPSLTPWVTWDELLSLSYPTCEGGMTIKATPCEMYAKDSSSKVSAGPTHCKPDILAIMLAPSGQTSPLSLCWVPRQLSDAVRQGINQGNNWRFLCTTCQGSPRAGTVSQGLLEFQEEVKFLPTSPDSRRKGFRWK